MRLGIDIDDVLYDWYGRAHSACAWSGITNGVEPATWSPHEEYGCTFEQWLAVMTASTLDGTLYSGPPLARAIEALDALRDAGHTIHLVTARGFMAHGDLIRQQTVRWLADYDVPHDTLTFSKDKTVVRVDYFADDSEKNVGQLVAAGIPACLITAPHNGHVDHTYRVAHIAEFAAHIIEGTAP